MNQRKNFRGWTFSKRGVVASMLLLLITGATGCAGEGAGETVSRPVFPEAPQDTQLYDTSILDDESRWTVNNAHDPAIIKTDQGYYVYSTDVRVAGEPKPGVMVRKSDDLIHWTWVGQALPGIPQEALDWTGAVNLWAPDVIQAGDTYRMYYSASSFGSTQSAIGLQTAKSPEGPWTDEGLVVKTLANEQDKLNAIDANPIVDAEGNSWMVYGSFLMASILPHSIRIPENSRTRVMVPALLHGIVQPKKVQSKVHTLCITRSSKVLFVRLL